MIYITPSERDLLQLLADGRTTQAIADHVRASHDEIESALAALFAKLGAKSQSDALATAGRRGLLTSGRPVRLPQPSQRSATGSPVTA